MCVRMYATYIVIISHTSGSKCKAVYDEFWETMWPNTASNTTARQKCPGGAKSIGTYVRKLYVWICYSNIRS